MYKRETDSEHTKPTIKKSSRCKCNTGFKLSALDHPKFKSENNAVGVDTLGNH